MTDKFINVYEMLRTVRETDMRLRDRAREHYADQAKVALYPELVAALDGLLDAVEGLSDCDLGYDTRYQQARTLLAKCRGAT